MSERPASPPNPSVRDWPASLAVLDASPNAIVGVDVRGRIRYVNPQAVRDFGYAREELLGQPVEQLIPADVQSRHEASREAFLGRPVARPMGIGLDLAGRRKDGTEFPVEISLAPVRVDGSLQVFATVVDISTRKAAEAQLHQAQKLESIGRLAGGIAHDFNNMLFAISGFTELLEMELTAPGGPDIEQALERVAAIHDAAERAASLTAQLLTFSRRRMVEARVISVRDAVTSMIPMLRSLISEDIELVVDLDPSTGRARIDPSQLDQVLVNLAVNARDAMPDGGRLRIETGNAVFDEPYAVEHFDVQPGDYVVLAVSDTGIGMDVETRQHVFEPFFTTKEAGKGTGLGLATIYGIVRQAGGHIWLYSEPGQGTTFKLYLPRTDAPQAAADPVDRSVARASGRILVVEDDPAVRTVTVQMLERDGYAVSVVEDGRAAMDAIEAATERFDVVVSDVVMPNVSGIELADWLWERDPGVGVVLLSGYTSEAVDVDRARRQGALFLSKPASFRALVDAIGEAARSARHEATAPEPDSAA